MPRSRTDRRGCSTGTQQGPMVEGWNGSRLLTRTHCRYQHRLAVLPDLFGGGPGRALSGMSGGSSVPESGTLGNEWDSSMRQATRSIRSSRIAALEGGRLANTFRLQRRSQGRLIVGGADRGVLEEAWREPTRIDQGAPGSLCSTVSPRAAAAKSGHAVPRPSSGCAGRPSAPLCALEGPRL